MIRALLSRGDWRGPSRVSDGADRNMSGVVLRCPTCGTTQSHPGECDACFEGEVRYFCGNHSPGLWLDEPVCKGAEPSSERHRRVRSQHPARRRLPARETRRRNLGRRCRWCRASASRSEETPPSWRIRRTLRLAITGGLARWHRGGTGARQGGRGARGADSGSPAYSAPRHGVSLRLVLFVLVLIALVLGGLFLLFGVFSQFMV